MKLCFVGDSLIEYYDWQARFPRHTVVNLGVSGETASELLVRAPSLGHRAGQPEAVIIMTGTNDILMGIDFLSAYEHLISTLGQILPAASLLACGLFPMPLAWQSPHAICQANAELEGLARRYEIRYLDGVSLVPDTAASRLFFMEDGVHLTSHGYAIWSAAIEKQLRL